MKILFKINHKTYKDKDKDEKNTFFLLSNECIWLDQTKSDLDKKNRKVESQPNRSV